MGSINELPALPTRRKRCLQADVPTETIVTSVCEAASMLSIGIPKGSAAHCEIENNPLTYDRALRRGIIFHEGRLMPAAAIRVRELLRTRA